MTLPNTTYSVGSKGAGGDSNTGSEDEAWIVGGANGVLIAADTEGSGHVTTCPSDEKTMGS